MHSDVNASLLDVLALSDLEREILLYLLRNGPTDDAALPQATGLDPAQVDPALKALIQQGHVERLADGRVDAVAGQVRGRTALPAQLWHALLATDRAYSERDTAVLRAAIPILQLARARLIEFADHGPGHALRVKSFAAQLGCVVGLSEVEQDLLRAAALFHDVGNIVDRERHHTISQETVLRLTENGALPFTPQEAALVGLLCRWHRREYDPNRCDESNGRIIHTGLLASILRVADAMDLDYRRSDYRARWSEVIDFFFPGERIWWTSLEEALGIRIRCSPGVELQVFTQEQVRTNTVIDLLRRDLVSTPLPWAVRQFAVREGRPKNASSPRQPSNHGTSPALLAFPFEPHSVVMAALSRTNLAAAGHDVELLCYPDTAGGPRRLWSQALPARDPRRYRRLVVIGDRSDPTVTPQLLRTVRRWQEAGVHVSALNRHEANWTRLPALLQLGTEAVLGSDWAYFWGEPATQRDLAWGRIAALCTRDPTQATVGLTEEDETVTRGLLKTVYDAAAQPAADTEAWAARAGPILDRIAADDRAFFREQAAGFDVYTAQAEPGRVKGCVLCFEGPPGKSPQSCYWALEAAIERGGRSWERGIHFKVPYAVAAWRDGDMMELLAINHWREEEAFPIRVLYPCHLTPPPAGNEGTIQIRLPPAQTEQVVRALVGACNGQDL